MKGVALNVEKEESSLMAKHLENGIVEFLEAYVWEYSFSSIESPENNYPLEDEIYEDGSAKLNATAAPKNHPQKCLAETVVDNSSGKEIVDAKNSQDVDQNDCRKNIVSNPKNDKQHVYKRRVTKKCVQGDEKGSSGRYLQDQSHLAVNAAVPGDSYETAELPKVTEKLVYVEMSVVQHVTAEGFSEASVPCDIYKKDVDLDKRLKNNTDSKGHPVVEDLMSLNGQTVQHEFLVKWRGQSHIHNSWVSEEKLTFLAKEKLERYKEKYGMALINICHEEWSQPQRVIALRAPKKGHMDAFIKWSGLPYDECTWERLDEPAIEKWASLINVFKQFEQRTLDNDAVDVDNINSQSSEVLPLAEQPKELKGGLLFQHQLEALNWLRKCWYKAKNVILADEMGLGKTVSACAFISALHFEFKAMLPSLVLVPLSAMPNWLYELAIWAPDLNVVEYHGCAEARLMIRLYEWHANYPGCLNKRTKSYKFNVLLTTYETILADSSHLRGVPWEVLIVDEGHRLKNSGSELFTLLNSFSFQQRILLAGTLLQNNISEMYNLLNFLQPSSFPSLSSFEEKFNDATAVEKVEKLNELVSPHVLRRLKKDVMEIIPPKIENMIPVELSSIQAKYYSAMLTENYKMLQNIGKEVAQQSMLDIVMQLRKVCNHPYLIPGTEPDSGSAEFLHEMRIKASAKLTLLHSMLKLLHKKGCRVLIFSQMTKLFDILEDYLNVEYGANAFERVDGSVSVAKRQASIARFNHEKSCFVFLLSPRLCGLGINLATVDTVIIYDSDFSPHADIQAIDRAYRIGQSNRLLVYRLYVCASVEEHILQLAKKKPMLDQPFVNKSGCQKKMKDTLHGGTEELFSDPASVSEIYICENSLAKDEPSPATESKQTRRVGGLGDVYQANRTDGKTKILWDENADLKLLERSIFQASPPEGAVGNSENDMLGSVKDSHATINGFLILSDGIFLGLDSRSTREGEDKVYYWDSDSNQKWLVIIPGVCLTAEGGLERNNELWKYLKAHVKAEEDNMDSITFKACDYLQTHPKTKTSLKCSLYIAGFSISHGAYVVHYIKDTGDMQTFTLQDQQFHAVGAEFPSALNSFKKLVSVDMTYEDALKCMIRVLINTSVDCACCGGDLIVMWVSQGSCTMPFKKHLIDAILDTRMTFDHTITLFFFSKESYWDMNYSVLRNCLKCLGIEMANPPSCLGVVRQNWTMFMIRIREEEVSFLFGQGKNVHGPNPDFFRTILLSDNNQVSHQLLMALGVYDLLLDVRENPVLDHLIWPQ